ncbi:MAG: InlB B-repeat-containing protein [Eubacteriales bacterium]|nr:InlB B-repeat-containing protein [Eubacteriales bacterium]
MKKKSLFLNFCFLFLLGLGLLMPMKAEAALLPDAIEDLWLYTGSEELNDAEGLAGRWWIRGNAYGKPLKGNNPNILNTSDASYKAAYDKLQQNKFLTEANICIIYLPNCPYTHSWLPVYQNMAKEAGAKVVLVDVTKYDTSSLLPYYWASKEGAASPIVLYKDKDGNLGGMSGVHDTFTFLDILTKCGYFVESDDYKNNTGYTTADRYKRTVLSETNKIRIQHGKPPLSTFDALDQIADIRAEEVAELASHTRPNGELFNKLIDKNNIKYPNWVGENLCCGSSLPTPMSAVIGWMNSKPHRENILSDKYSHLSIGYYANKALDKTGENNGNNWIQIFAGKCDLTDMRVTQYGEDVKVIQMDQGASVSDLNLDVTFNCSAHGTSTMPLLDEMLTGFDAGKAGEQRATIHVGEKTCDIMIEVGEVESVALTDDMVRFETEDGAGADTVKVEYDGMEKRPRVLVANPGGDYYLMEDYSYSVEYQNNVNVGKASVTITGKGNYYGTVTKEFEISPKSLEEGWVSGVDEVYEYTGNAINAIPSVQRGTSLLKEGTDYTVSYGENTGEMTGKRGQPTGVTGTGTVTVTGKGNYAGTVEKSFEFKLNDVHKWAEVLRFRLNPLPEQYATVYEFWTSMKESFLKGELKDWEWNLRLADAKESFEKFKAGKEGDDGRTITLEEIVNCPMAPGVAQDVQDFCRFLAELEGVDVEPKVEVETKTGVSEVEVSGLEASIAKEDGEVAFTVSDLNVSVPFDVSDKQKYDVSTTLPLDINLTIDGGKAELAVPVTISMTLPEGYYQEGDTLVALHYKDGLEKKEPTELMVTVEGNVASFSTQTFSPFVIVKKLPQYEGPQLNGNTGNSGSGNDGMSFGTGDGQSVAAPTGVYTEKVNGTVEVHWTPVTETSGFEIKGYEVLYADNDSLKDAKATDVVKGNMVKLPALAEGTYYIAVRTVASSPAYVSEIYSQPSGIQILKLNKASVGEPEKDPTTDENDKKPEDNTGDEGKQPEGNTEDKKPGDNTGDEGKKPEGNTETDKNKQEAPSATTATQKETSNGGTKAGEAEKEEAPVTVTVLFDGRKGKISEERKEVMSGQAIGTLPKAVRKGYTFAGWYTHETKGELVTEETVVTGNTTVYAHWIKGKIAKVSSFKVTAGTKTAVLRLKKVKAAGYEIQYSLKKNMKKAKVVKTKATVKKIKKLKAGKKYYVQVRAYKKDKSGVKVYGKWSKKKVFHTKTR